MLNKAQRARFMNATKQMKNFDLSVPGTASTTGGTYQKYIEIHNTLAEHRTVSFLAWHRILLWEFEEDLITADKQLGNDGNISIPYWPWHLFDGLPGKARGKLWNDDFMGGDGNTRTKGALKDSDWKVFNDPTGVTLRRELAKNVSYLSTIAQIKAFQSITPFDVSPFLEGAAPSRAGYANTIEGWVYGGPGPAPGTWTTGLHNCGHVWIGGHMLQVPIAPNDPVFYLNHANVDRLWAEWQFAHPKKADQYPADALLPAPNGRGLPRKVGDIMRPWDGTGGNRTWKVEDSFNFQKIGDIHPIVPPLAASHNYTYDIMKKKSLAFKP